MVLEYNAIKKIVDTYNCTSIRIINKITISQIEI